MTTGATTLIGSIKVIKKAEGYGFITHEGIDYFFHRTNVQGSVNFNDLRVQDTVKFVPKTGPKGPMAVYVIAEDDEG